MARGDRCEVASSALLGGGVARVLNSSALVTFGVGGFFFLCYSFEGKPPVALPHLNATVRLTRCAQPAAPMTRTARAKPTASIACVTMSGAAIVCPAIALQA